MRIVHKTRVSCLLISSLFLQAHVVHSQPLSSELKTRIQASSGLEAGLCVRMGVNNAPSTLLQCNMINYAQGGFSSIRTVDGVLVEGKPVVMLYTEGADGKSCLTAKTGSGLANGAVVVSKYDEGLCQSKTPVNGVHWVMEDVGGGYARFHAFENNHFCLEVFGPVNQSVAGAKLGIWSCRHGQSSKFSLVEAL